MITEIPDGAHLDSDNAFSEKQPVAWGGGLARAAGAAQHRKELLVHLLGPVQYICTTCEQERVLRGPVMAECSQQAERLLTWCTSERVPGGMVRSCSTLRGTCLRLVHLPSAGLPAWRGCGYQSGAELAAEQVGICSRLTSGLGTHADLPLVAGCGILACTSGLTQW